MGSTCSTHRGDICIQTFSRKIPRK